ncbi:uncharacterized protein LOC142407574 [Mycteria americana]|uniref:uncharacterized protein LOC142407574 n=1 Tax=Mycteria americana TaxID=33587 RepID=UPI003F58AFAD
MAGEAAPRRAGAGGRAGPDGAGARAAAGGEGGGEGGDYGRARRRAAAAGGGGGGGEAAVSAPRGRGGARRRRRRRGWRLPRGGAARPGPAHRAPAAQRPGCGRRRARLRPPAPPPAPQPPRPARPGSARLGSARSGSARLGSALGSPQPVPAGFKSQAAPLSPVQPDLGRPGSAPSSPSQLGFSPPLRSSHRILPSTRAQINPRSRAQQRYGVLCHRAILGEEICLSHPSTSPCPWGLHSAAASLSSCGNRSGNLEKNLWTASNAMEARADESFEVFFLGGYLQGEAARLLEMGPEPTALVALMNPQLLVAVTPDNVLPCRFLRVALSR